MVLNLWIPEQDFGSTHLGSEEVLLKLGNPISLLPMRLYLLSHLPKKVQEKNYRHLLNFGKPHPFYSHRGQCTEEQMKWAYQL